MTAASALDKLRRGGHALVIENGGKTVCLDTRGVAALLATLRESPQTLAGAALADKVVGKAAAALMVLGRVAELYAVVASRAAMELLEAHGVKAEAGKTVPYILNRAGNDWCPMEKVCRDINDPGEMLEAIKAEAARLAETNRKNKQ